MTTLRNVLISRKAGVTTLMAGLLLVLLSLSAAASLGGFAELGTGHLKTARAGHTATALRDGSILVVGGVGTNGYLTQSELVLADGRVAPGPKAIYGRGDHTATLLGDGRVLIAGGRDAVTKLETTELFDPETGAFQLGPRMSAARAGQVAVALRDGRVLIAGGDREGSAEIVDADARTSRLLSARLLEPRSHAGATLLRDGRILIVGGNDADGTALTSAEVFDPVTERLTPVESMSTARISPVLRTLPDGKVQVLGGDRDATMEIFNPRGYFTAKAYVTSTGTGATSVMRSESKLALVGSGASHPSTRRHGVSSAAIESFSGRSGGAAATIASAGRTFLIGGRIAATMSDSVTSSSSSSAWVSTDKTDYFPGEYVIVTGGAFEPGETVRLHFERNPETTPSSDIDTTADEAGNISNSEYQVLPTDLGVSFLLTASGLSSENVATTSFTDGNIGVKTNGPTTTLTFGRYSDSTCSARQNNTVDQTQTISAASSGVGVGNPGSVLFSVPATAGGRAFVRWTRSGGTAAFTSSGSSICIDYSQATNASEYTAEYTQIAATTLSVAAASGTYGGSATLTATLTANGTPVSGRSITFSLNGTSEGSATTDAFGTASISASLSGINANSYPGGVVATFAGDGSYAASSGSGNLTVNKANAAIVVNGYTGMYDGLAHGATGSATGVSGEDLTSLLSLGATFTAVPGGSAHWSFPGNGNYNSASGDAAIVISKANATIHVDGYTGVYDGNAHGATGTATGVSGEDLSGSLHLGNSFTDVPGGIADWTFDGDTNYTPASGHVSIVISKATATIHVDGYTGVYDGNAHGATGTATGVSGVDLSGSLDLGSSFVDVPGGTASWSFNGGTNYNSASGNVAIDISKANATIHVDGYTGVYDGNAHGATGTATGVGSVDLSSSLNLGASFTNCPGGTASWSFTGGTNYNDDSGSVLIVIDKANATIDVHGYTGVYDGAAHGATGTASGVIGDDLTSLLHFGASFTNVPGGTANWTFAGSANYNTAAGSVNIAISKADASIAVNGYSGVYDGNAHGATGTAKGVKEEDLTSGLSFGDSFTNVPGGTAHWTFDGGGNYNSAAGDAAIIITVRPITVTADAKSKTYGDSDPALTYQVTAGSLVSGDTFVGSLTRASGESAGIYAIGQGSVALSPNYNLTFIGADLTITTRPVTVTADAKAKSYGDTDPALTFHITSGSLAFTDAFSGSLTRASGENVGSYAIQQGALALSANYTLTFVGASLTITQRPVTVTADAKSKILGQSDPALTYQVTSGNLVNGDTFSGALTRAAGEGVGSYPIQQGTLALSANYALTYVGANLTIAYASASQCGHVIQQPINTDGTSVFKKGSTVPAKFRVCDANGNSVGTPGVVSSFNLVQVINGTTVSSVTEDVYSTTPDAAFRWDATAQQWIFNINTKGLTAGQTYIYRITLNDGSYIFFQYGLK